ncbi:MAG TPA: hypothetical protein VFP84_12855 [Kofleriaceae bacterium]|nr:hypothetical protein [Kofleriaceae bacterium]
MLFDAPPAELPTATLVPSGFPSVRQLAGDLDRWLARRWAWLAPRAIPLLVASLSLVATLGGVKYAGQWARSGQLSLGVHVRVTHAPHAVHLVRGRATPTEIEIRPLNHVTDHGDFVILTIDPPEMP